MTQFIETVLLWITPVIIITYIYIKFYVYNYWKRHGIPYEKPCVPFGNIPLKYLEEKIGFGDVLTESYEKFKQYPFHGFYVGFQPVVMINDPQLIRTIFVKEFASFHSRGWFSNKKLDPLSNNMFLTNVYNEWRSIRNKLSPTFTPAKLRQAFSLITEISNEMIDVCDAELERNNPIDGKAISKRYTMDIITSLVYRFKCNCLKSPNNEFARMAKRSFEWGNINMLCSIFRPKVMEILRIPFNHRDVVAFFSNMFKKIVNQQLQEPILRKDIMSAFLEMIENDTLERNKSSDTAWPSNIEKCDQESVLDTVGHAHLLLLAGYDTSSITMEYCLYELTVNPEIMEKLQNEIDEVAESQSGFTYDSIAAMEYLDMVISETLRKYPPVQFLNRISNKDYLIPGSNYTIPKGMRILISPIGIHQNPEFFPDPTKFDPERYNKQNPNNMRNFVDLSFGEGPRGCIGKKLALVQTKLAIVKLLYNYNISLKNDEDYVVNRNTGNLIQDIENLILCLDRRK